MCNQCLDVFSLKLNELKTCSCGKTMGKYIDDLNAEYKGDDVTLIGFSNFSFISALKNKGTDFTAFTIKEDCKTFKR